jgi:hypothetical protein
MRISGWIIISFCIDLSTAGQSSIFPIQPDDIPGIQIISTKVFEGNGLWGYINGGADIYHEYGFERVNIQEISLEDQEFKIESYCMSDETAAFGIFSVNRFRCVLADSVRIFHCISPYQILAVINNYYLIISNQVGSNESIRGGMRLLRLITDNYALRPLYIPEPFTMQNATTHLKCMKGKLGLMNGYPSLTDLFDPYTDFTLYVLSLNSEHPNALLATIEFTDKEYQDDLFQQLEFIRNTKAWGNDQLVYLKRIDPYGITFMKGTVNDTARIEPYLGFFGNK